MADEAGTIAIVGGASGIGLATARLLAANGARIALLDRDNAALRSVESEFGADACVAQADVTDSGQIDKALEAAEAKLGRLSGLVVAAGIRMHSTPVVELSDEAWDRIIEVNLRGVFVSCRSAARLMIKSKTPGSIVAISSISGVAARYEQSAYGASKAAVIQLMRVLALELAGHGIRANTVCPGTVNTAMFQLAQQQDGPEVIKNRIFGSSDRFRPGIPLRRIAEPEEVASLTSFLLSEASRHITGQSICIDGGETVI